MKNRGNNSTPRSRNRARFNLRGRVWLIVCALGLCSVSLIGRAAYVQLVNRDFYQREGNERFVRNIEIPTSRGMITDRNGEPVAVSSPVESIWCDPQELLKYSDRLPELANALGEPLDALTSRITQRAEKEFYYLKRRISPDEAKKITALAIPGVNSKREFRRFYPQGEAMAHVLGFTNIDDRGQEGVELAFDEWLRGKPGAKKVIRDRRGRIVENIDLVRQAQPGQDLTLSIDRRIQYLAFRELRNALTAHEATAGSAVVLDVATGEVLAMVNLPTFNPNSTSLGKPDAHRNRAVTDLFEPGSTAKPLTVAAGLEAGVITPASTFNTSPGWMPNGKYRTTDTHNYGVLDTTGVIRKSSNVGAAKIAQLLANGQFYDFFRKMGYGQSTRSGFPGEASGLFPAPAQWSGTSKQTMSYGYGIAVTPLQVAHAYATLANGGRAIQPTFVKGERNEPKQVLDPVIAGEVMKMMQTVTEAGGTATQAAILGYHVAGKTGTSRKASGGGYSRKYLSFFAGVVPVDNPRFAMAVVVNEPSQGSYYGGLVAGPVFHNVMEGALRLMDVPPDDIETWIAAQEKNEAKHIKTLPMPNAVAIPAGLSGALRAALPEDLH
ncbi:MAG: penicillin-binding transpeptidase domain-containing protein [Pseudoxanthomonas sp.]